MKKTIIIGSGLSGLSCAHYLDKKKFDVKIYEKESYLGGRVATEVVNGFKCDVGFQVLLNNYEEAKKIGVYDKLDLKYFNSGASIYNKNKNLNLYNPFYHPIKFLQSNILKILTLSDMINLFRLFISSKLMEKRVGELFQNRFSNKSQKLFLNPFFKGIFLSKSLDTDTNFFLKIFKKFALGKASLPSNGMHMLPKMIAENSNLNISFNSEVKKVNGNKVYFKNGESEAFDYLIIASPIHNISQMTEIDTKMQYNENKTIYISSSKNMLNKSILLVSDDYETNSIQCLTNISKSYSDNNFNLYSLSSLNTEATDEKLINEFKEIMGIESNDIRFIKSYTIKEALPSSTTKIKSKKNIYFCGDWMEEPSIDGALKSGRIIANKLNQI